MRKLVLLVCATALLAMLASARLSDFMSSNEDKLAQLHSSLLQRGKK